MGCCESRNSLPKGQRSGSNVPFEEEFIRSLEKSILHSRSTHMSEKGNGLRRTSPPALISGTGKQLAFSYILISDAPVSLKQEQMVGLLGKSLLTLRELEELLDLLIEISTRIHPFTCASPSLSRYRLHHYISSLEVGKLRFKRNFLGKFSASEFFQGKNAHSLGLEDLLVLLSSANLRASLYQEYTCVLNSRNSEEALEGRRSWCRYPSLNALENIHLYQREFLSQRRGVLVGN